MILDSTLKSLEVLLGGAVTTNELPVVVAYADNTTTAFTPGSTDTQTSGVTAVTIVAAPAASTQRQVKFISIYNKDTVSATVTVQMNDNATLRIVVKKALAVGDTLIYTPDEGWYVAFVIAAGAGAALTRVDDTNVTLVLGGTPSTALLQATSLTLGWAGTLAIARGGTGQATATAAFNALDPLTTLGDLLYHDGTDSVRLAGQITTTRKFVRQTGTGAVSAAPVWDTILAADVPGSALTKTDDTNVTLTLGGTPTTALLAAASLTLGWTGLLGVARGGTGAGAFTLGSVVFAGVAGVYTQDNANLFWDDTNNRLGIGNAAPARTLDVSDSTNDGSRIRVANVAGGLVQLRLAGAHGTIAAPTGIVSGDLFTEILLQAYDGATDYFTGSSITTRAAETWSGTARGTDLELWTVKKTTTTQARVMVLKDSGAVDIGVTDTPTYTTDINQLGMAAIWNAAGVTFTGIKLNITDTASAALSLLMDLQVGAVSKFRVDKTGLVTAAVAIPAGSGGTGLASYAVGDLLYASGATTLAKLADVASGSILASGGVGAAPAWSASPSITGLTLSGTLAVGTTAQTGSSNRFRMLQSLCQVTRSATLSVSDNVESAVVTFDTEDFDTDTIHSLVSNTSRLTVPIGGKWMVIANVAWATMSTSAGRSSVYIYKNGVKIGPGYAQDNIRNAVSQTEPTNNLQIVLSLAANDYIEMTVYQNSGAAVNMLAATRFGIFYIGE